MNNRELRARKWKFIFIFLLLLIFRYMLDLLFRDVAPTYSVAFQNPFLPERLLLSRWLYIPFALLTAFIAVYKSTVVSCLFCILFVMNGASSFSMYAFKSTMTESSFRTFCLFWGIFALCATLPPLRFNTKEKILTIQRNYSNRTAGDPTPVPEKHGTFMVVILVVAVLSAVALSGLYGDFRIFIDFSDVYAYRFEFIEAQLPSLVSYYLRFLSGAILPFLFAAFLTTHQYGFSGLALLGGLFTYGIDGLKTTLLIYVLIFFFYIVMGRKNRKSNFHRPVILLLLSLIVGIYIVHYIFTRHNTRFFSTELYRVLVVPASIGDNYFQFIQNGKPLLLSQSILRAFIESPYEKSIYYLVTSQVQSGRAAIANTGLVGDAYANFKMVGILLYPILYCLVFKIWEVLTRKDTPFLAVSIGFVIIWNAISLSFFTWLLSGGVIVFCLLIIAKNKVRMRIL